MWKSQVRLDDETISRVRQVASKRRWSLNQAIGELLRDQLAFLDRCQSGDFGHRRTHSEPEADGVWLDTSDSQV